MKKQSSTLVNPIANVVLATRINKTHNKSSSALANYETQFGLTQL